jgi:hypothetical protein
VKNVPKAVIYSQKPKLVEPRALPRIIKNHRQKPLHQASPEEELRAIAEERFKQRELQKADAPVAMREYRDAEQALRDKTAKLRAERLARESAKKH